MHTRPSAKTGNIYWKKTGIRLFVCTGCRSFRLIQHTLTFTYCLDETFRMWISFLVDSMDNLAEIPNELETRRLQSMCLLVLELMLPTRKSYLHLLGLQQFLQVDSKSILKINNKTLFIFIFLIFSYFQRQKQHRIAIESEKSKQYCIEK